MSLFPAYADSDKTAVDSKTPSWLTNTSFADFQGSLENKQTNISISSDESDPLEAENVIEIKSDDGTEDESMDRIERKNKKSKRTNRRSSRGKSPDTDDSGEKRKKRKRKHSRSRSRSRQRSRSSLRRRGSKSNERRGSRLKKRDSRKKKKRSKSRRSSSSSRDRNYKRSRSRSNSRRKSDSRRKIDGQVNEEMIARMNSKKVFIEEVGGSWKNAFREDRKGDKTNLSGTGFYARDVAKYKSRVKIPLGKNLKKHRQKVIEETPRFHHKLYIKQINKAKNVTRITKDCLNRPAVALTQDFKKEYLSLALKETVSAPQRQSEESKNETLNPLGVYSEATVDYLAGVGGIGGDENDRAVFQNSDIELKRIEFNTALRERPHDVNLWLEFIDFQDEALRETVFESNDDKESKKMRKKNGEILRAKALTERKLAICRSAIEKNTRSIDLAVKRLELSRDLLDSKTLDQQWKELIFVYPENIALWKRYLLFIQTHYIRFSITDTIKAYKGCVLKLKSQLEKFISEGEDAGRILEFEHGILDIIEAGALVWLQSAHTEKAIALYQALLEFNLFSPDFERCGNYSVDDRLSLFEPIWDSGVGKVGQVGARGWGVELQERVGEAGSTEQAEELHSLSQHVEDGLIANGGEKGHLWLQVEVHRDQEYYFPWRKNEPEPEDPDRIVDFDTVLGFIVLFSSQESKLRILLSLLRMLGYEERSKTFSNLVDSEAVAKIFNTRSYIPEDFTDESVLHKSLPTYKTKESLAIFAHYLFAQTYNRFKEPFRTKIILMWLDFEREIININDSDKGMKKDLKKLVKSLLKEDRNNVELVAKFVEIEYQLEGYETANQILETSFTAFDKKFLKQQDEDSIVSSLTLYRTGVELELNEILKRRSWAETDTLHKDKLQWFLIQAAAETNFKPLTDDRKSSIIALVDSTQEKYLSWIHENVNQVTRIKFSKKAPSVKHSLIEVIFLYAWLSNFTFGWQQVFQILQKFSFSVREKLRPRKDSRFNEDFLTLKFLDESINKIMLDILWYESHQDIKVKQNLRTFYIECLHQHSHNGYFLSRLGDVEDSTSVVSSVWREVCQIVKDKNKVNHKLVEEILRLGLTKFVKVLDRDSPGQLPCVGLGFLNKLHNLLEFLVKLPMVRHSPLVWRMMLWTTSILQNDADSLKTMLYRAIQDVAWSKALYVDTGVYLEKIGKLYCTTRRQLHNLSGEVDGEGDEDDEDAEPRYEEIPGTLEHVTELMVEKDLRLRLPLQELDVLLEPVF